MMLMRNASGLTRSESRFRNERVKIAGRRSKWVAIGIMNGWWQRIGNKEQATTVILGRVVRRGVKRRHAHPLLSRLEKDYLNSPPYRSSPNLYEPHSALVSGVSLSNLPPPFPLISLSLSLYLSLSLSFFLSFFLFLSFSFFLSFHPFVFWGFLVRVKKWHLVTYCTAGRFSDILNCSLIRLFFVWIPFLLLGN